MAKGFWCRSGVGWIVVFAVALLLQPALGNEESLLDGENPIPPPPTPSAPRVPHKSRQATPQVPIAKKESEHPSTEQTTAVETPRELPPSTPKPKHESGPSQTQRDIDESAAPIVAAEARVEKIEDGKGWLWFAGALGFLALLMFFTL